MLPETGPIKKCTTFLATFTKESRSLPIMTNIILDKGSTIVRTTIICIGSVTPRTQLDVFADIFLNLNAKYPSEFGQWLRVLTIPQFPTPLVTDVDKNVFMRVIMR